jgi:hypothetical protein
MPEPALELLGEQVRPLLDEARATRAEQQEIRRTILQVLEVLARVDRRQRHVAVRTAPRNDRRTTLQMRNGKHVNDRFARSLTLPSPLQIVAADNEGPASSTAIVARVAPLPATHHCRLPSPW